MINTNFTKEQAVLIEQLKSTLNKDQMLWLSGFFAGLSDSEKTIDSKIDAIEKRLPTLTILYGSRTGNGEGLAKIVQKSAQDLGFIVSLKNMSDYKTRDLQKEKNLLIIVSTHGEGEPPFAAKEMYDFIHGKRAPKLNSLNYAVLGLGDSGYFHFCKTGIDFDMQLEKLGAKRVHAVATLDVNFAETAEVWINDALAKFQHLNNSDSVTVKADYHATYGLKNTVFSKNNPFQAPVLHKVGLHGRGSDRQTIHIELSTEDNPDLIYEPGDAVGVIPVNTAELITEVLSVTGLDAGEIIQLNNKSKKLEEVLYKDLEISKITVDVVKRYLEKYPNKLLSDLTNEPEKFKNYLDGRDVVDLFTDFPAEISADNLVKILRPLQPRYYSISSSPKACQGEVHLTVGVVKYHYAGRDKKGACSNYLSDIFLDEETVPVFIESNPGFRLPLNNQTAIIMVGAGTGIAPYRAFVQHRELSENPGKSWLFFGNRNFETEFLYQTEWQDFLKSGALTKLDVAFSRDGTEKVYVQDKLWENASEIYKWLEDGAHFYICGDMKNMARAVQDTLMRIVETQGLMNKEQASEYIDSLEKSKRLQLDVY